ncbi:MAG: hypothetical protein JO288_13005 [Hyphomicrobiales bacterium]|nr:hypothetical protein [Hyphomicrobiales bacterium]
MFVSSFKALPLLAGLAAACAAGGAAQAQWLPPLGAAPPGEIVQRLHAQGYVLIGPLRRNQTVYLADVNAGPAGRERLVIDAWSGEILQRFVESRRAASGYVVEGGEFSAPPPLGPPPARDFFAAPGSYAYRPPSDVRIPSAAGPVSPSESSSRPKSRPRPASGTHTTAETKPAPASAPSEQVAKPTEFGSSAASEPPPSAPASGPQVASPASVPGRAGGSTAAGPAASGSAPAAGTQARIGSAPQPASSSSRAEKAGDKSKVNDVPVNPLE